MSKLTLQAIGRLGRDAEVHELKGGKSAIRFSIATNPYKDKTVWVECTIFRDSDKTKVADYLDKGTNVFVEGEPSAEAWENRDGEMNASLKLIVNNLVLLGGSGESESSSKSSKSSSNKSSSGKSQKPKFAQPADDDDDSDLPF